MRKKLKKLNLFKKLIISYITVLCIPMLFLGIFIYFNIVSVISHQVEESMLTNLSEVKDVVDIRLSGINHIGIQLPFSQNILPSLFSQNLDNMSDYNFHLLMGQLKDFRATNNFVENIYIYFRKYDLVIGADSKYSKDTFYDYVYQDVSLNKKQMFENIENIKTKEILSKDIKTYDGISTVKKLITYMQPVPSTTTDPAGTLLITMDVSSINQLISNVLGKYSGNVYILDEKDNIITSVCSPNINIDVNQLRSFYDNKNNSIENIKIDGKSLLFSSVKSSNYKWTYIAVIPSDAVYSRVNHIRVLFILILLACLAIGIFLTYIFSYDNYNPIKKIRAMLPIINNIGTDTKKDDLEEINSGLKALIEKDKISEERLERYIPVMQTNFITLLLLGNITTEDEINELIKISNIEFSEGPYAVMLFHINDYEKFFSKNSMFTQGVLRFSIMNVIQDVTKNSFEVYSAEMSPNSVVSIIDFRSNVNDMQQEIKYIGEETITFFKEHFDLTITVGVGGYCSSLMEICKAYMEAQSSVEYKIVKGKASVILFDEIISNNYEKNYYTYIHQNKIIDCLKMGDFHGINKVLQEIIENTIKKPMGIGLARCIYYELINTAVKSLEEVEPEDYTSILMSENILQSLLKCETLKEVFEKTISFYSRICEQINENKLKKQSNFKKDILKFVKDNYNDPNLSLTIVADKFSLSTSYISRLFTAETQYSFVEYLHFIRIGYAKEALINSDNNIANIAVECGYADSHSFIRSFKKYEGITPGKYRQLYSDNNSNSIIEK